MTCVGCSKIMIAVSVSLGGCSDDGKSSKTPRAWHPRCFVCTNCHQSLLNEQYFVRNDKWPYCLHCRDYMFAARCVTCVKPIRRYAAMAFNLFWHRGCFRCQTCLKLIEHEYYLAYDNLWVCPGCYKRPDNVYDYGMPDFLRMDGATIPKAPTIGDTTSLNPEDLTADDFQIFMDDAEDQLNDFPENTLMDMFSKKKTKKLKRDLEDEDNDLGHFTITDTNAESLGIEGPDEKYPKITMNDEFSTKTTRHMEGNNDRKDPSTSVTSDIAKSTMNTPSKGPQG